MRNAKRRWTGILLGAALLCAAGACATLDTWSYGRPDVRFLDFRTPPYVESAGGAQFRIVIPSSLREGIWVVPVCRVEDGRAVVRGLSTFYSETGPFVIEIKGSDEIDPATLPFVWEDPDGATHPMEVKGRPGTAEEPLPPAAP